MHLQRFKGYKAKGHHHDHSIQCPTEQMTPHSPKLALIRPRAGFFPTISHPDLKE